MAWVVNTVYTREIEGNQASRQKPCLLASRPCSLRPCSLESSSIGGRVVQGLVSLVVPS